MDTQYYVEQGIKSSISDRIALLRTEVLKMNQKDFAELVGLSQSTLSQYEGGKMLPSIMTALTIAMKCNVSLDWLCGRDEIHLSINFSTLYTGMTMDKSFSICMLFCLSSVMFLY